MFPEQPDAGGEVDLTPPPTSPDVPTSAALRPPLSRARMALVSARHEPPCLRSYPFNPDAWAGLITATELLITRQVGKRDAAAAAARGHTHDHSCCVLRQPQCCSTGFLLK